MIRWNRSTAVLSLVAAAACGGDGGSGPPPTPAAVVAVSANPLANATVGAAVAAPTFEVRSAAGVALRDVAVTVAVSAGGGTLTNAPTVSLAGPTPIGTWTLGTTAGAQSVTVTVNGVTPLVFTVQSQAGAPAELVIVDGDNQFGVGGAAATVAPRVRVRDAFANAVAGAVIGWTIDAGGGTLAAATSVTDAQGIATAPTWTLGAGPAGEQAVVASVNALTARIRAITGVVPASLTIEVAAPASSTVGAALATAPAFAVRDSSGTAITGFPVAVAVVGGGGALVGAPTATSAGSTAIGTWTMGTLVGPQLLTVTAAGLAPETLTVQATAGAVANAVALTGNGQSALAGDFVPVTPVVRLTDEFGNRVPGQLVLWTVALGGGTIGSTQSGSNADGDATAPAWRLGRTAVPQQLTATINGRVAAFNAVVQTEFRVDLRYVGATPSPSVLNAFTNAARRIEAIITGDLPDINLVGQAVPGSCGTGGSPATLTELLDDIIIFVRVDSIDGPLGVLGSAGPCAYRQSDGFPALGGMRFDRDDMPRLENEGRLESVILHEMLHVIGVGTIWANRGLLQDVGTSSVRFTGAGATDACVNDNAGAAVCLGSVPVENCLDLSPTLNCGAGTINSHWKESVFQPELMTGYLSGGTSPFSAMTVRSLGDVGYEVNVLAADPYSVPAPGLWAGLRAASPFPDIVMPPPRRATHQISPSGRITPIPER